MNTVAPLLHSMMTASSAPSMTGWVPILEPMRWLQPYWFLLLIPLAFGIAVIYKALRIHEDDRFAREVAVATFAIVGGVTGLGILFAVLIEWIIPAIPVPLTQ